MSNQSMEPTHKSEPSRRISGSSSERIMVYVDDLSFDTSHDLSPDLCRRLSNCYTLYPLEDRSSLYLSNPDTIVPQLDDHSVLYLARSDDKPRHSVSIHTKPSSLRPTRSNSEPDQRSSRRSSVQSSRSRMNSCSKPTPLGRRQLGHQTSRSIRNARTL
ncbi:uncharacterized protein LOC143374154 [Andrena cerasifolii]|uniref:uncharacterized protein LOC143374154 n=1 Tax=Andrena cerasifolii TaxID=2819439 RepID=UPI004037D5E5